MPALPRSLRIKLLFVIAGLTSCLSSARLYFARDDTTPGIFNGLRLSSIHSLGTLPRACVSTTTRSTWRTHSLLPLPFDPDLRQRA